MRFYRRSTSLAPLVLLAVLVTGRPATAITGAGDDCYTPAEATSGTLLLRDDAGQPTVPAPVLETDVSIQVSGLIARATVRQKFTNPGTEWAEGVYVFPVPETAAVDHMRMRIGERVVEGQIKERAEAKRTYEKAKAEGKRASLVEQERPNIFTTSVANIAPQSTIEVEIEYQETLRYVDGVFRLRFPMVVGPRFIPGRPLPIEETVAAFDGTGWAPNTDRVPDASRITPPVRHPNAGPINPVHLRVDLDAGVPLARVESSFHAVEEREEGNGVVHVELAEGPVPADRDFELVWEPAAGSAPAAALFTEEHEGDAYALFMVMPPQPDAVEGPSRLPREVVFVIDKSGSMHGASIAQARSALLYALQRLDPGDRFNVIQFNNDARRLFSAPVAATSQFVSVAEAYVQGLEAEGGTNMRPAIEMALADTGPTNHLRQVIFMTDGAVGNESELFGVIQRELGSTRLFTVGIGSAPNSHFMRRAAQFGRGTFTHIGKAEQVEHEMTALLRKLERPALADIEIDVPGRTDGELFPARIPDLYAGEPVVVAARFASLPDRAVVRGRLGNRDWSVEVPVHGGRDHPGVHVLWARRKIAALMDERYAGAPADAVRQQVLEVALGHHLVSKYTSLVAVDVTPVRQRAELLRKHAMQTNLPHGWTYEKVFGLPQTATWAPVHLLVGFLMLAAAAAAWRRRARTA